MSMSGLRALPVEIVLEIFKHMPTAQSVNRLARTCKALFNLAMPILYTTPRFIYRKPRPSKAPKLVFVPLRHAAERDCAKTVHRVLSYDKDPEIPLSLDDHQKSLALAHALRHRSFRVAVALLRAGADIQKCEPPQEAPESLGDQWNHFHAECRSSLYVATERLSHNILINRTYSNERDFWQWKKKTMLLIIWKLRLEAIRKPWNELDASLAAFRRGLNAAFGAAAELEDIHSMDAMDFLVTSGADPSWRPEGWSVWCGADAANVIPVQPFNLFLDKVEFLLRHGVDFHGSSHVRANSSFLHDMWKIFDFSSLHVPDNNETTTIYARTDLWEYRVAKFFDELWTKMWEADSDDVSEPVLILPHIERKGGNIHTFVRIIDVGEDYDRYPTADDEIVQDLRRTHPPSVPLGHLGNLQVRWVWAKIAEARYYKYHGQSEDLNEVREAAISAWHMKRQELEEFCRRLDQLPQGTRPHTQSFWSEARWCLIGTGKTGLWTRLLKEIDYDVSETERKYLEGYYRLKTPIMRYHEDLAGEPRLYYS